MLPARFAIEDAGNTATAYTNSTSLHNLTGGELTADGETIHTIGWSKLGDQIRSFFDGVESGTQFTLTAGEQADIEACTRIGVWYGSSTINAPTTRLQFLQLDTQGSIYP